jgi:hypothetical protein
MRRIWFALFVASIVLVVGCTKKEPPKAATPPKATESMAAPAPVKPEDKPAAKPEEKAPAKPDDKPAAKPEEKAPAKPDNKPAAKPEEKAPEKAGEKPASKPDEKAPAKPDAPEKK